MQRRLVVPTFVFLLLTTSARFVASQNPSTASDVSSGIRTVTLATPLGEIKVILPDDIRSGDTISGTVTAEAKGKDEKEKHKNATELDRLVVQFVTQRWPVSGGVIQRLVIPVTLVRAPEIILLDEKGKKIDSATLPVAPAQNINTTPNFIVPELGQSGRPFVITGLFDGDSSNTNINIGGDGAKVIAESPRSAILEIPRTVLGANNIVVNDNGNSTTGSFRALKIDLTAPKTSLIRGESTELHVEVQGLQGITQPVQVHVQNQTPSNINLAGGNTQNIVIQPQQVTSGGTFNWNTTVTGTGTGGFNITGTILTGPNPPTSSPSPTTAASSNSTQAVPAASPQVIPVGASSAELKQRCDELREQLKAAKGPCEQKEKDCAELERKLDLARAAADKTQADYDKKKVEFEVAAQSLLDEIRQAAKKRPLDWEFSLTKPDGADGNKWASVTVEGVVIWFAYPKRKDNTREKMDEESAKSNGKIISALISDALRRKLKAVNQALVDADKKNKEAIAARLAAKQALDKCVGEKDALCPKVKDLEAELAKCEKEAATQAEAERKAREKEDADKRAATEAKRVADDAERKKKADEARTRAEAERQAEETRRIAKARADKQKVCTRCLKMFVEQAIAQANLTAEQKSQIDQFLNSLDDLNGKLQNIQSAADLIPQLSQLSDLLGKLNAGADVINRVNTAINQIKQLATGGNGPEQLGAAIQLAAGALDAAAQAIPLLGPLASYFKVLADAVTASIAAFYAFRDMEGMRNGMGRIDDWSKSCQVAVLYASYDGDLDKVYNNILGKDTGTIRETPEMRERLKQYLMVKIKECCLKMLKTQCPVLK